jgi:hypothetical protein
MTEKDYLDLVDEIIAENITITDPNLLEGVRNAVMLAIEETVEVCIIACREAAPTLDGQLCIEAITKVMGLDGAYPE